MVNQGGASLAALFYEADATTGIALFERGLALDPGNLSLRTEFALALLALDRARYAADALGHLRAAAALAPRTALDRLQQQRARALLAVAESGDDRALAAEVRRLRDLRRMAPGPKPPRRNDD